MCCLSDLAQIHALSRAQWKLQFERNPRVSPQEDPISFKTSVMCQFIKSLKQEAPKALNTFRQYFDKELNVKRIQRVYQRKKVSRGPLLFLTFLQRGVSTAIPSCKISPMGTPSTSRSGAMPNSVIYQARHQALEVACRGG
jgi:hypothetical protein